MRRLILTRIIVLVFAGTFGLPCAAIALPNTQLDQTLGTLVSIDSLLRLPFAFEDSRIFKCDSSFIEANNQIDVWVEGQKRINSTRTGLELSMSYDHKFGSRVVDDLYDEFVNYSNRVQATLSWNIMGAGFMGRRLIEERAELEGTLKKLQYNTANRGLEVEESAGRQEAILNAYYNQVVDSKIRVLASLLDLQIYLLGSEKIYPTEVIQLRYDISLLQGQLRPTAVVADRLIDGMHYLNLQTEFSAIAIDSLITYHPDMRKWEIERRLLSNDTRSINYWKSMRVAPFARIQYYDKTNGGVGGQSAGNVGVTVSLPLSLESVARKRDAQGREAVHRTDRELIVRQLKGSIETLIQNLNTNYVTLRAACEADQFFLERLMEARKKFRSKHISVQTLCGEYEKLLSCKIAVCDLITKRELMKIELASLVSHNIEREL